MCPLDQYADRHPIPREVTKRLEECTAILREVLRLDKAAIEDVGVDQELLETTVSR